MTDPFISNPVQRHRIFRGLSIADLAAATGMSRAQLVAVEAGERPLSADEQEALAVELQISEDELNALARSARG